MGDSRSAWRFCAVSFYLVLPVTEVIQGGPGTRQIANALVVLVGVSVAPGEFQLRIKLPKSRRLTIQITTSQHFVRLCLEAQLILDVLVVRIPNPFGPFRARVILSPMVYTSRTLLRTTIMPQTYVEVVQCDGAHWKWEVIGQPLKFSFSSDH